MSAVSLSVCVSLFVCVCARECISVRVPVRARACLRVSVHVHARLCARACVSACAYVRASTPEIKAAVDRQMKSGGGMKNAIPNYTVGRDGS